MMCALLGHAEPNRADDDHDRDADAANGEGIAFAIRLFLAK